MLKFNKNKNAQVRMTDHLMNSLKFSKVRDFEVAWIDAKVDYLGKMRDKGEVMTEKEVRIYYNNYLFDY